MRWRRLGLRALLQFTREKIHIWRGLAIVLAKVQPYAWIPPTIVADIGKHIEGLAAEADRIELQLDP
jgi:hypothetical protein